VVTPLNFTVVTPLNFTVVTPLNFTVVTLLWLFTVVYITECDYSYYGLLSYFCKETVRLRCIYYSKFIGHFVTSHRRPDGTFCNCWLRATSHTESVVTFIIHLYITFHFPRYKLCRCQWPRGLSRGCVPAGLLGLGSNPWEWEPVMYTRLGGH